jgi:peptidoglycan/xylan/chitin deacetylase (PgdA/CDA1 family)
MMALRVFLLALAAFALTMTDVQARPRGLVEPALHILPGGPGHPRVALTFDACMGRTDHRILDALISGHIPATIFVTGRWLKKNRAAFEILLAHPDLFEIEDHGAMHVPAVDRPVKIYGIASAGSAEAVKKEVEGGRSAIEAAGGPHPLWFRGSTALYSLSAISQIRHLGFSIAGFSVNGDGGSLFSAALAEKTISRAKDGDVVISHINQPTHAAGAGVVKGILDLKARGYGFVKLDEVQPTGTDGTTGTLPVAKTAGHPSLPKKG